MPRQRSVGWLDEFRVRPSKRAKYVRLKVIPPGRVEVVVPRGFDQRQLPSILARHEAWLTRTVEKVRRDFGGVQPLVRPAEIELPAIARRYTVLYRDGDGPACCRELPGGRLEISCDADGSAWRALLQRWLAGVGREYLVPWFDTVAREVGLRYGQVTVRGQKSRWGSCSAVRNISLNHSLLFLAPEVVRYLFIHELCHTVHMNHSRRYWALVGTKEPAYRELDDSLRTAACRVPAWARRD